jgi:acyl phosphate:glycerol-3-phosphate acyltransferase
MGPLLILAIVSAYLLGSVPAGFLLVRFYTGTDIRAVGSGRTGSTNVLRAGGGKVALMTGVLDVLKAASAVWIAQRLLPGNEWAAVLAGIAAIIGHNYSIFIGFKGGAGGAPTIGAAFALWPPSLLVVVPLGAAVWYFIGYASVATMSFSLILTALFAYRAYVFGGPWQHVVFGLLALAVCLWALRPNIKRLIRGEERLVGWRAKRLKQAGAGAGDTSGRR